MKGNFKFRDEREVWISCCRICFPKCNLYVCGKSHGNITIQKLTLLCGKLVRTSHVFFQSNHCYIDFVCVLESRKQIEDPSQT